MSSDVEEKAQQWVGGRQGRQPPDQCGHRGLLSYLPGADPESPLTFCPQASYGNPCLWELESHGSCEGPFQWKQINVKSQFLGHASHLGDSFWSVAFRPSSPALLVPGCGEGQCSCGSMSRGPLLPCWSCWPPRPRLPPRPMGPGHSQEAQVLVVMGSPWACPPGCLQKRGQCGKTVHPGTHRPHSRPMVCRQGHRCLRQQEGLFPPAAQTRQAKGPPQVLLV